MDQRQNAENAEPEAVHPAACWRRKMAGVAGQPAAQVADNQVAEDQQMGSFKTERNKQPAARTLSTSIGLQIVALSFRSLAERFQVSF